MLHIEDPQVVALRLADKVDDHSVVRPAAAGGDGILEIDANPNPLRTELMGPLAHLREGRASLGDMPGIGIAPDLRQLAEVAARGS